MPIKRKIKIELNSKEDALVHYEMEWEGMILSEYRQVSCIMRIKERKR